MKRLAFVLLALPLLTSAVQAEDKFPETVYYPLAVGNTWTYKIGDAVLTYRVAKHEKVGDLECALVESLVDGKVQSSQHLAVTKEGLYRVTTEGKKVEPPVCILQLPPKKGETWKINSKGGSETIKGKFTSGEAEVKVPAGTYKTITVTSQDLVTGSLKPTITYYFAEKVGMVKQVIVLKGQTLVLELVKFEAGKK